MSNNCLKVADWQSPCRRSHLDALKRGQTALQITMIPDNPIPRTNNKQIYRCADGYGKLRYLHTPTGSHGFETYAGGPAPLARPILHVSRLMPHPHIDPHHLPWTLLGVR